MTRRGSLLDLHAEGLLSHRDPSLPELVRVLLLLEQGADETLRARLHDVIRGRLATLDASGGLPEGVR